MKNPFQRIQEKEKKVSVSATIDKSLFDRLNEIKEHYEIESFSPFVNEVLWLWLEHFEENVGLEKEEGEEKKRNKDHNN